MGFLEGVLLELSGDFVSGMAWARCACGWCKAGLHSVLISSSDSATPSGSVGGGEVSLYMHVTKVTLRSSGEGLEGRKRSVGQLEGRSRQVVALV